MVTKVSEPPLRKIGRPMVTNPKGSTMSTRRHRARKKGAEPSPADVQAETKQMAERLVAHSMTKVKPPEIFTESMLKLSQSKAEEVLRIIVNAMPRLTRAVISGAEALDPTCLSIVGRWIPNPEQHTRVTIPQGLTVEEASTHLLGAALSGEMSIKDSGEALNLVNKYTDIQLSAGLTERLRLLRERLEEHSKQVGVGGGKLPTLPGQIIQVVRVDLDGNLIGGADGEDE